MTVVKINSIEVDPGEGADLERRFMDNIDQAAHAAGFLGYELLRPVNGDTYFSISRWATEEDFEAFVRATTEQVRTGAWRGDAQHHATLLEFVVAASSL